MSIYSATRRRRGTRHVDPIVRTAVETLESRTLFNGTLDPTFDTDGFATTHFLSQDVVKAVAVQPDGKVIAVGYESTSNTFDVGGNFAIARYNPNGTLDTTFDGDGKVTTDFGALDGAEAVLVLGSGASMKILVGGWTGADFNYGYAVARYNADGSLDTTFDGDGKVVTVMDGKSYHLIAQPDGKVIAVGSGYAGGEAWAMARYHPDGSLDTSFGTQGIVARLINNNGGEAKAGIVLPDGKIILTGNAATLGSGGGLKTLAVARFLPNGTLDTTFDNDGYVVDVGAAVSQGNAIAAGPNGSFYVAATVLTGNPGTANTRLFKFTSTGAKDASFGTGGSVVTSTGGLIFDPVGVAVHEPTGNILVAATSGGASNQYYGSWTVSRVLPNGTLDASFGNNGRTNLAGSPLSSFSQVSDLVLQADGKVIAGGTTGSDFAVARLTNVANVGTISGVKFEDFDADGVRDAGEPLLAGQFIYLDTNDNGAFDTGSTTFPSADVPRNIADNNTFTESTLTVSGYAGTISDLNVRLNIGHTWDDDLDVFLVSPSGTTVELFSDVGEDEDGFIDTTLDDEASTAITAGAAPFTGAFRPVGSLAALDGEDPNGTWRLRVRDDTSGDTGTITNWSIVLAGTTPDEPNTLTDAQGQYTFSGLAAGAYVVRDRLLPGHVRTVPASGAHRVTVVAGESVVANFGSNRPGYAGAGLFDTSWDGDGIRLIDPPQTYGTFDARTATQQADGKILVAGYAGSGTGSHGDVLLMRFNTDGSFDTSFGGGNGYVTTDIVSDDNDSAAAIVVQPDGKILIGGEAANGSEADLLVLRYLPDGTLDSSFGGGDGYVTHDFNNFGDSINGIALQDDGRIVVTGVANMIHSTQLGTLRYLPDGTLDESFGDGGIAIHDFFGGVDFASDVIVDADDKIVVVGGSVPVGGTRQWIMLRYNSDGTFDASFSGDGRVNTPFGATAFGKAVLQQPDGKYVVGGTVDGAFTVGRYNSDGTVDTAFGTNGFTTVPTLKPGFTFATLGLALQPDGKILLGGEHDPGSDSFFAVARFLPDGSLDPNFGSNGTVAHDTPGFNGGSDLVLQSDNKIVVVGGGFEAVTARYLNDVPDEPDVFAVLVDGILTVTGTAGDDTIALGRDGGTISATLAGQTLSFPMNEIQSLAVVGGEGSDTLDLSGDLLKPVSIDLGDDANETFNITNGFFTFAAPRVTNGERLHVNVSNVTGGDVRFATALALASLDIDKGAATVNAGADRQLSLGDLTIGTFAVLDVTDNDVVVRPAAAERDAVLRRLEEYVAVARNTIPRGREGLTSSTAATNPLTGLAVGVLGDEIVVKYTYNGDANLDGTINSDDYFRIDSGFLGQPTSPTYAQGDFNYNELINSDDYFLIDSAFLGQPTPQAAAARARTETTSRPAAALEATSERRKRRPTRDVRSRDLLA